MFKILLRGLRYKNKDLTKLSGPIWVASSCSASQAAVEFDNEETVRAFELSIVYP